jgi:hypothetical protein
MNRAKLKAYAPKARREFIQAVTDRAAYFGLTGDRIETVIEKGDVAIIAGKAFPRAIAAKRKRLEERIGQQGFEQVMEAMAYTWFNRFAAIRFMELHGYLEHGYRVLSHPEGKATPEIIEHAEHVDLPGLDREKVIELKIEGTRESELYGMILIAQCNALHKAMPFLFEKIDDETELLLPENLLHSDSLIRKLVNEIPEEEWKDIEIIGWLYQFYISEKKDQVIGKVVKSEDIPAATQLFTPNWIVKYMVQNTLGRQWVATYPDSQLKSKMEYYIEPAEQTPEVEEQLKAVTPKTLNPEELTFLDPATGSGHILVEAYDLFKAIYQERGYRAKDIPGLILKKNLFGLEIDDRAAQLAAFALMMKARADDRRIFDSNVQPQVLAIQESKGLDAQKITEALNTPILKANLPPKEMLFEELEEAKAPLFSRKNMSIKGEILQDDVARLISLFEHGKTFGSLIRIPEELIDKLPGVAERVTDVLSYGDMHGKAVAELLMPLVIEADILSREFYIIATNPPYMGSSMFDPLLKTYCDSNFQAGRFDLFGCFMLRGFSFTNRNIGMITPQNWMFRSSYEEFRKAILDKHTIDSIVENGRGIWGSDFGSCTFVLNKKHINGFVSTFKKLYTKPGDVATEEELKNRFFSLEPYRSKASGFNHIPGSPLAYYTPEPVMKAFSRGKALSELGSVSQGLATADNRRFLRFWWEIDRDNFGPGLPSREDAKQSKKRWFPLNKGGGFRKWYGNQDWVIDWKEDGEELFGLRPKSVIRSPDRYFQPSVSWSRVTIGSPSFRFYPEGFIFDAAGPAIFSNNTKDIPIIGLVANSSFGATALQALSPLVNYECGEIEKLPIPESYDKIDAKTVFWRLVKIFKDDWDGQELSWEFQTLPFSYSARPGKNLEISWSDWSQRKGSIITESTELEKKGNQIVAIAFNLEACVNIQVDSSSVSLFKPKREQDILKLISFAIGCMMGRYSLDKPGLIYAHISNEGFDPSQYQIFPADEDGIIPLTEIEWFEKDAANRVEEFIGVAWPKDQLEENLTFVSESLGQNQGESPRETTRRYLATGFFKHHLSMYKKRPIYWLFSSGRQRAFQCLVYLHRYNEGTLSRMRTDYVIPLQGKMSARIDQLAGDITSANATSHRKRLEKEKDKLVKQLAELRTFDGKLRHYADLRISLDLDDGVKVNYGKFGDLLAEVKAVTGSDE